MVTALSAGQAAGRKKPVAGHETLRRNLQYRDNFGGIAEHPCNICTFGISVAQQEKL
jgi:hypothetical protein